MSNDKPAVSGLGAALATNLFTKNMQAEREALRNAEVERNKKIEALQSAIEERDSKVTDYEKKVSAVVIANSKLLDNRIERLAAKQEELFDAQVRQSEILDNFNASIKRFWLAFGTLAIGAAGLVYFFYNLTYTTVSGLNEKTISVVSELNKNTAMAMENMYLEKRYDANQQRIKELEALLSEKK